MVDAEGVAFFSLAVAVFCWRPWHLTTYTTAVHG